MDTGNLQFLMRFLKPFESMVYLFKIFLFCFSFSHSDILTLPQLERLAKGIMKISFYNPRLVLRFCSDLSSSVDSIYRWTHVSTFLSFLKLARVTDEKIWGKLVKWMNKASR